MDDRYTVRITAFEGGERHVFTFDRKTNLPEPSVTAYSARELRPSSGSYRTLLPSHRGIAIALSFLDEVGADLYDLVEGGRFLDRSQVNAIAERIKRGRRNGGGCRPSSAAPLIRAFGAYVGSLGAHVWSRMPMGAERLAYFSRCGQCVDDINNTASKTTQAMTREGLDEDQHQALIDAIGTPARTGPWANEYVTKRNWTLVIASLLLGWRQGEFLAWRKSDIDFASGLCRVVRRPDSPDDPRLRIPSVKTLGRELALPSVLADALRDLFEFERKHLPEAWSSPWVFTTAEGRPLSPSAISKMYSQIMETWPAVGPGLSCHKLRHSWNEAFSYAADEAGLTPEEEVRVRMLAMGWSNPESAWYYLRRKVRVQAQAIGLAVQRNFLKARRRRHD